MSNTLPFSLHNYSSIHFDLIGLGGTGGLLLNNLLPLFKKPEFEKNKFRLNLFDGDEISPSNFERQNFIPTSIIFSIFDSLVPYNLTLVLPNSSFLSKQSASNYKVFNKYIQCLLFKNPVYSLHNCFVDYDYYYSYLYNRFSSDSRHLLFSLACVDNNFARRQISSALSSFSNEYPSFDFIFITTGNSSDSGSLYSKASINNSLYPSSFDIDRFFCFDGPSDSFNQQTLAINSFMASLIFSAISDLLFFNKINFLSKFNDSSNSYNKKSDLGFKAFNFLST
ncbi:hypothetical protein V6O07_22635 [Arthrospira platensis SPKY2]